MQKAMFVEESKARAIHAPVAKWLCGHKLQHQHWLQEVSTLHLYFVSLIALTGAV